jgi:hypothetical protein
LQKLAERERERKKERKKERKREPFGLVTQINLIERRKS